MVTRSICYKVLVYIKKLLKNSVTKKFLVFRFQMLFPEGYIVALMRSLILEVVAKGNTKIHLLLLAFPVLSTKTYQENYITRIYQITKNTSDLFFGYSVC